MPSQVPLQNMKSLSILRCISVHHSGIYNDSTSAYIHSASGQLRAKVIDVTNIESLDIVVGNYGNATDTNNPKVGLTELTSGSLEATTIPRGVNGTIEKFSDTLGKTPHIFKVDAVGMGWSWYCWS